MSDKQNSEGAAKFALVKTGARKCVGTPIAAHLPPSILWW